MQKQQQISDAARQFAQERLKPFAAEWDREHRFPKEAIGEMAELGFGMLVPEQWGGCDTGYLAYAMALEEIAAGDGACSTIMSVHNSVGCVPILNFGNDEQKNVSSSPWPAVRCSAPSPDRAPGRLRCQQPENPCAPGRRSLCAQRLQTVHHLRAERRGGDCVCGHRSGAGKRGISALIVPTDSPGYTVARVEDKLGQHASDTCQILFEDVKVPVANRLGEEGEGYKIALANLEGGRVGIASQSVGMARAAFEAARDYARERESFGKPIIEHQAVASAWPTWRPKLRLPGKWCITPPPCVTAANRRWSKRRWPSCSPRKWPRRSAPRRCRPLAVTVT
jgi:hypothetical protein